MSSITTNLLPIPRARSVTEQRQNPLIAQVAGKMKASTVGIYNMGGLDLDFPTATLGPDDCWIIVNYQAISQRFLLRPGDAMTICGDLDFINAFCGIWGTTLSVIIGSYV